MQYVCFNTSIRMDSAIIERSILTRRSSYPTYLIFCSLFSELGTGMLLNPSSKVFCRGKEMGCHQSPLEIIVIMMTVFSLEYLQYARQCANLHALVNSVLTTVK